jgi:CRP/FNR family transcriptional regulator, cyclic AMP receptor protein
MLSKDQDGAAMIDPVDPDIFNDVPIFALLDAEERQVLAQQVAVKNFVRGTVIFKTGEPGGHAYLIQKGKVNVCITDIAGEDVLVDVVEVGGLMGMSSLLAQANHLTTAVAIEPTCAIEIDRHDISTLLQKKPQAGLDMMTMIEKQLRATHELMRTRLIRNPNQEIHLRPTIGERVSDFLTMIAGDIRFVIFNLLWFVIWIVVNINLIPGVPAFDPFPFGLLTMIVSLEAIFLSLFVLISQNRQAARDKVRNDIEYEVNVKAELEIGELLHRLTRIEQHISDLKRR